MNSLSVPRTGFYGSALAEPVRRAATPLRVQRTIRNTDCLNVPASPSRHFILPPHSTKSFGVRISIRFEGRSDRTKELRLPLPLLQYWSGSCRAELKFAIALRASG